ncbi:LysE family translocator [Rhizobium sp. PAMB 3174]
MDFVPSLPTLLTFAAACMLLTLTPGPDMTLQIGRALKDGRTAAFMVLLGTNIGLVIHTVLVAFGVSALIVASPAAFFVLKTGGAAYLLWLAFHAIRKGSNFVMAAEAGVERRGSHMEALLNGFWVNLLNPKVVIFFMTFLPQFVQASDPHVTGKLLFLGFYFIVLALPVTIAIILAAGWLSGWLMANRRVLRWIDYTFAGVFSIFAVKIFFTHAR